jgi:protein-S-isoprenylcysteine O-methyltransferase Ste14
MNVSGVDFWNAWVLVLPFLLVAVSMTGVNKDLSKRLSDMTGYTERERLVTVIASLAPYPFMIVTLWLPFTSVFPLLCLGLVFCGFGLWFFAASVRVIKKTPPDARFTDGPYRLSRNPMYVSATFVFIGICLATANLVISIYLALAVLLQHYMILAEERVCREKYGSAFDRYLKTVPRYLFR